MTDQKQNTQTSAEPVFVEPHPSGPNFGGEGFGSQSPLLKGFISELAERDRLKDERQGAAEVHAAQDLIAPSEQALVNVQNPNATSQHQEKTLFGKAMAWILGSGAGFSAK
jgi:hypothetical protein